MEKLRDLFRGAVGNGPETQKGQALRRSPNTLNAHRLMIYGGKEGREDEVSENLFRAYFLERADLTDKAALASVGERAGLDRAPLAAYLASDDGAYVTGAAIPIDGGELAGGLASRDWLRAPGSGVAAFPEE